ncbi:hypothetical protein EYF80_017553 [Liparis tanakae]|uniref:Uncharacterized protein n=1 Tax=Liparis tanakae TaxID=230148 RepID=A0A4Z2I2G4_9TELE|nr:hypothetical protein EYF80_017553 [Liparis tanakae]
MFLKGRFFKSVPPHAPVVFRTGEAYFTLIGPPCDAAETSPVPRRAVSLESVQNSGGERGYRCRLPFTSSDGRLINALALCGLGPLFLGVTALFAWIPMRRHAYASTKASRPPLLLSEM